MKIKDLYLDLIKSGKNDNISDLDIRFLLSHHLNFLDSTSFFLNLDKSLNEEIRQKIISDYESIKNGKPISYVLNEAIFLGNKYYVDESVLIPRMETEELVINVIKYIDVFLKDKPLSILDIGVGSGVISIELKNRLLADVYGVDINLNAIKISERNAKSHNAKVSYFLGDTYPNIDKKYNVIVSNPPYIKDINTVDKSVLDYEPHNALFISEENNVYKKVFSSLNKFAIFPCLLVFEIAPDLVDDLNKLTEEQLKNYDFSFIYSKDINNKVRFLTIIVNNYENI